MYLRTKIEPGQRLGEGLGVVTTVVKYVGGMVIEKVLNKIERYFEEPVSGFKVAVNPREIGLYSKISPPDRLFRPCTIDFPITAHIPVVMEGMQPKLNVKKNFWFKLSYKYNGNDLQFVKILPQLAKTGKPEGLFDITFEGSDYEIDGPNKVKFAWVSKIRFSISGTWKPPNSDTTVSFQGFLMVWGNGHAGIVISSEKNWVSSNSGFKPCPTLPHYQPPPPPVPKPPVRKPYSFTVLFPFRERKVTAEAARGMAEWWVTKVPEETKKKIKKGDIPVSIIGYASRPGGELYNLKLSEDRAENVLKMLRIDFIGRYAKYDPTAYGEFFRNLPSDWFQRLKRAFNPNKYDQAAVIHFEDVE